MTIQHHPSDELLLAYSAGSLDQGQHVAIATHLLQCGACRGWVRGMEGLGGSVLNELSPSAMADDALARLETRLDEPIAAPTLEPRRNSHYDMPGLPPFVRSLPAEEWKWLAPNVQLRRLALTEPGDTRVLLLRSKAGVRILPHDHTGFEMTCVLTGSFSHDGACYGPGDFDFGDSSTSHDIAIGPEGDCVSLVAMQGDLRLKGLLGRLVQPFISL
jgi:putative transcriptional regulator